MHYWLPGKYSSVKMWVDAAHPLPCGQRGKLNFQSTFVVLWDYKSLVKRYLDYSEQIMINECNFFCIFQGAWEGGCLYKFSSVGCSHFQNSLVFTVKINLPPALATPVALEIDRVARTGTRNIPTKYLIAVANNGLPVSILNPEW